jgi:hypothetical protein
LDIKVKRRNFASQSLKSSNETSNELINSPTFCAPTVSTGVTHSDVKTGQFQMHQTIPPLSDRQIFGHSFRTTKERCNFFIFFYYWWGGTKSLGTAATSGLLYKPQMTDEDDCRATGGMKIGRGNRSTRRKPTPAPLVYHLILGDVRSWQLILLFLKCGILSIFYRTLVLGELAMEIVNSAGSIFV